MKTYHISTTTGIHSGILGLLLNDAPQYRTWPDHDQDRFHELYQQFVARAVRIGYPGALSTQEEIEIIDLLYRTLAAKRSALSQSNSKNGE